VSESIDSSRGIRLIIGLGNVGAEYARTRHNAGFWFVDRIADRFGTGFRAERRFHGELARASIDRRDVWLLKPSTLMNRSGQSAVSVALFYRILPDQILVAHDELDLPPGDVRLKLGGGTAGHNGLKDVRARLSHADFWRLRIGIGHPRSLNLVQDVADFVLHPPRRDENEAIDQAIERAQSLIELAVSGQFERAMMRLHTAAAARPAAADPTAPARAGQRPAGDG
jgi:PTH1 family peptidyl-tRNA hydrolase